MQIDLAKLDSKIKKLEEIRRLISDPETLSLLLEIVTTNGHVPAAASTPHPGSAEEAITKPAWKEGTHVAAIGKAAQASEKPFSGYSLAEKMQEGGYEFGSGKPGLYVTDVLRNTLLKRGVVRIHKKGHGSEPTLFERVL